MITILCCGCEFVTFVDIIIIIVDIIKTARSMISDCDVTHCCHMSLFILIRVNRKDIDKIYRAHRPQMADLLTPQPMFIVSPDVQTNKQTSVTPFRGKLSVITGDHVKSLS